jgi:hypothetical protein
MMPGGCLSPMHPPFTRLAPGPFFLFEVVEVSSEYDVFDREVSFANLLPKGSSIPGFPWSVSVDYG